MDDLQTLLARMAETRTSKTFGLPARTGGERHIAKHSPQGEQSVVPGSLFDPLPQNQDVLTIQRTFRIQAHRHLQALIGAGK